MLRGVGFEAFKTYIIGISIAFGFAIPKLLSAQYFNQRRNY